MIIADKMNSTTTNRAAATPIIIIKSEPDDPGTTRKKIRRIPVTECYLSTDKIIIDKYMNGIRLCSPSSR